MKIKKSLIIFVSLFIASATAIHGQLLGDVNNDARVDVVDALLVAQCYVGPPVNLPWGFEQAADVDLNGSINIVDALLIAQYYVGLIECLPPDCESPTPPVTSPDPNITHLDNPFEEAVWYVDQEWSRKAREGGGEAISLYNTAFWLDHIDTINPENEPGLRTHLDAALEQGANLVTMVLYNLPNRNCTAGFNDTNLRVSENGYEKYAHEFIDPIAGICSDPLYAGLRLVIILEPNSIASLVSGGCCSGECADAIKPGGYDDSLVYAIEALSQITNVYIYMDYTHSAWLGWPDQMHYGPEFYMRPLLQTTKGLDSIDGFALNVGYYNPLEEPFLPDLELKINDSPIYSSAFYEWNHYADELSFARDVYERFVSLGMPEDIGFIIDTSRNGWGGPDRPTQVSRATNLEDYVNESRVDRRQHRGNYCNIPGGIGEPPQVNPEPHIDAYVWAWPPGYSDGRSTEGYDDGIHGQLGLDPLCDPLGENIQWQNLGTDAIDAPSRFEWNQAQFDILLQNAYPPLD